jgi:3-hydroxyisobutyrate dehydrogenase-like beta-hydroxyacid dehydrogenase
MPHIGFLGLGNMGKTIVGRLLDAGHEVSVWNRSTAAVDELVERGATRAQSIDEALSFDISLSMLADDSACASVLGTVAELPASHGRIHVNMASISPEATASLATVFTAHGYDYVASPVLGRPAIAAEGRLNAIMAGPGRALTATAEIMSAFTMRQWNFGETPRTASIVKLAMNYSILHALQAISESVTLVESYDIDSRAFIELMSNTLLPGPIYAGYGSMIAEQRYTPVGFAMNLGLKDLRLTRALAAEQSVQLPTADVLEHILLTSLDDPEIAGLDWSALAETTRRAARQG